MLAIINETNIAVTMSVPCRDNSRRNFEIKR